MTDRRLPDWPRGMREELAAEYVGLSQTALRDMRRAGTFPAPVPLTRGRIVYLREDLDAWLDGKAGRTPESANDIIEAAFAGEA